MKKRIVFPFILFSAGLLYSCNQHPSSDASGVSGSEKSKTEVAKAVYRCPMDTDVVSDKPGECPKCGMELEKVNK